MIDTAVILMDYDTVPYPAELYTINGEPSIFYIFDELIKLKMKKILIICSEVKYSEIGAVVWHTILETCKTYGVALDIISVRNDYKTSRYFDILNSEMNNDLYDLFRHPFLLVSPYKFVLNLNYPKVLEQNYICTYHSEKLITLHHFEEITKTEFILGVSAESTKEPKKFDLPYISNYRCGVLGDHALVLNVEELSVLPSEMPNKVSKVMQPISGRMILPGYLLSILINIMSNETIDVPADDVKTTGSLIQDELQFASFLNCRKDNSKILGFVRDGVESFDVRISEDLRNISKIFEKEGVNVSF